MPNALAQRSLVLLSGGLDSSISLAMAREWGHQLDLTVTVDYGQKSIARETQAARSISDHYQVKHQVLRLPLFEEVGFFGALTASHHAIPNPTVEELDSPKAHETKKAVWVPNRNSILISIAAAMAEVRHVDHVVVGFNQEEAVTFPDNSQAYLEKMNETLTYSTQNQVQLIAPTLHMTKSEIIAKAIELSFPLQHLWSCYRGERLMCGSCESCMRLKRAMVANHLALEEYFENPVL